MKYSARIQPWFRKHDGWWYLTRKVNGRRVQTKLVSGQENQEAAWQKFHAIMAQAGAVEVTDTATFNELAAIFLAWSKLKHQAETTQWYLHYIDSFDTFYDGQVVDLDATDVERWLAENQWSQSTRRQAICCVLRVINFAVKKGKLKEFPVGLRELKKPQMKRREKVLTSDEHSRLVDSTDEAFGQYLFALRETGARPGEIRKVTAEHVDLKNGAWRFNEHKTAEKTGKARIIYLTPAMLKLTEALIEKRPSGPLFCNSKGEQWTRNAVRCRMRRLRAKLKLEKGTVAYSYRHTYTTDALERGVPIADLAELLGHSSTRMISEHYSHIGERANHMRNAAKKATGS